MPRSTILVLGGSTRDTKQQCASGCAFRDLIAKGDHAGITVTGKHRRAEEIREQRRSLRLSWRYRLDACLARIRAILGQN